VEVWQTSNLRRLRLGEEKKIEETTGQKYDGHRVTIIRGQFLRFISLKIDGEISIKFNALLLT